MSDQITKEHVDKMLSWLPEESVLKNPLGEVERLSTKVVPTLHRDIITLQSRLTAVEKEREELQAEIARLKKPIEPIELEFYRELCKTVPPGGYVGVLRENAERLIRELDSLRRDKERLDWLFLNWKQFEPLRIANKIHNMRQAIDDAIAQERKEKDE